MEVRLEHALSGCLDPIELASILSVWTSVTIAAASDLSTATFLVTRWRADHGGVCQKIPDLQDDVHVPFCSLGWCPSGIGLVPAGWRTLASTL